MTTLIDNAISSQNLLELLECLDRILQIQGVTRKNERIATIALFHSLCPLGPLCDARHTKSVLNEVIVMRNTCIYSKIYSEIYSEIPSGQKKTELDLFLLNVPTIIGHSCEKKLNFYVEIEMGKEVGSELQRLIPLRNYLKKKGLDVYPILVCRGFKRWNSDFNIPLLDIKDLEKMVKLLSIISLDDIPGVAYEWSATCIQILQYIGSKRGVDPNKMINHRDGLWRKCPNLKKYDFNGFIQKGRISKQDFEDFNAEFRDRIWTIFHKMVNKGLIKKGDTMGKYDLSIDGRDLLGCYLSFKEEQN